MKKGFWAALAWAVLAVGLAQVPLVLEFPEGSALELSSSEVVFDLAGAGFPPRELPAYYLPSFPEGPIEIKLFSNLEGGWALEAELQEPTRSDGVWLPPERIEVRLDGGPWLPLAGPVTLWVDQGPTGGYSVRRLELRLKVVGDELPGRYQGALVLRLAPL